MVLRSDLTYDLALYLQSDTIRDYCPNGLQIEGKEQIEFIVSGVSANQALIDRAIELGTDAILVHHGFFFKGEPDAVRGIKKKRMAALLKNDINLYGYHLPLDMHDELGNNVLLGQAMGWDQQRVFELLGEPLLGRITELQQAIDATALTKQLTAVLDRTPLCVSPDQERPIQRIAWCTGAAQDGIVQAHLQGADAYLSGEISERTYAQAKEYGMYYFSCGHHATERFGARALGEYCANRYGVHHEFVDIDNPV